jgi:hypothetical protein
LFGSAGRADLHLHFASPAQVTQRGLFGRQYCEVAIEPIAALSASDRNLIDSMFAHAVHTVAGHVDARLSTPMNE